MRAIDWACGGRVLGRVPPPDARLKRMELTVLRASGLWVRFLAGCLALLLMPAWAQLAIPPLTARVTDLAGLLSAAERQRLEDKLARFEQEKGSQIAILIVPSTQPETIEQYGIRVAEAWRLGRKGVDDGVLLLVARDDRALRIEVGYGLEGVIPDAVAKRIIEEIIVPRFRAGDYAAGLDAGIAAIMGRIAGEPLPPPATAGEGPHPLLPVAMMFAFVLSGMLRFFLGRLTAAAIVGTVAFFGAWWLLGSLIAALFVAAVAFIITLSGSTRGLLGTGRGGLGGWGGGGFGGGYRGGGGGFGGGGASGRW